MRKSASFQREQQRAMKGKTMHEKILSMRLKDLPLLAQADYERLVALAARPDSEIDLSDMPELTEQDWKNAVRG